MAFLLIAMLFAARPVHAQSNTLADMTGTEILNGLNSGDISIGQFLSSFDRVDRVPYSTYQGAIEQIQEMQNLPGVLDQNLGGLVDIVRQAEDFSIVNNVEDLASSFNKSGFDADIINNLVNSTNEGNLSTRLVRAISRLDEAPELVENLNGIIESLENLEGFDISSLEGIIQGAVYDGIGSIADINGVGLEEIKKFKETIDEMIAEAVDPEMITGFAKKIAEGVIPTELLDTLNGSLDKINDLVNKLDPEEFLKELGVFEDLKNFAGDAQELLESVAGFAEIQNIMQGLQGIDLDKVLEGLPTEALDKLIGELGSLEAVKEALEGILGDSVLTPKNPDKCESDCSQCSDCPKFITQNHERIRAHVTAEFVKHRNWIVGQYFTENIRPALAIMTSQLTAMGIQQVQIIGSFFDAKHQLETQRLFQTMTAQAHKDYHPSEGLCVIGTNSRSLANSYKRAEMAQLSLSQRMMDRQLGSGSSISSEGGAEDKKNRLKKFISTYCNPNDHAGGLFEICNGASAANRERKNLDINYTKTLGGRLTVGLDPIEEGNTTPSEEDIYALSANLFANDTLPIIPAAVLIDNDGTPNANVNYLVDIRALAAKRSVAQNSFAAIAGMKSQSDGESGPFLKAVLREIGIDARDIEERLGKNPSYHAQMEILTKDIYQQPTFYTNLYDKPVNVERKSAALLALELMQDRDIYNSLLRSEAILATLIEVMLEAEHERISNELTPVADFDIDSRGLQ